MTGGILLQGLQLKVSVKSTQFCLCFTFRAEKEKITEKMKEVEQQEEVDDSGFFAGKILFPFQSVAVKNLIISSVILSYLFSLQVVRSLKWVSPSPWMTRC